MDIDFGAVVAALKQIGDTGWFTLEADCYLNGFTADTACRGVQDLADAAKNLVQMWESA